MSNQEVDIKIHVGAGAPPPDPLSVDASSMPSDATVGEPYSGSLTISGGQSPYNVTLDAQNPDGSDSVLPDGLNLSPDGTISGTPTTEGDFQFSLTVTDSASQTGSARIAGMARK